MSGQMKVLIDRMNAMYTLDYQFRDVYMLTVAAEEEPEVPQRAEAGLTGGLTASRRAAWPVRFSAAE